ncbi:cytochrome c biogenesis protein CcsA [Paenibacillus lemnae]|uniref:Cytochrome c biogenesis protein CcsA n=1 Tax=Paenibacillus lemnae TaxID=1330551 RepID=A0A848M652_PAELE|nr:cytochrome c biogenesis protein CcsA [Paenibacillus lemnae]NMO95293.1 cytochrome c biogenesis protein CcsA [Paenibacillus lemnae]
MPLNLIYDIGIYIYALSLLFYISDCVYRSRTAKRTGAGLLVVAALGQIIVVSMRLFGASALPVLTTFDFLLFCSLSLSITSLVLSFIKRADLAPALLSVAGFSVTVLNRMLLTTEFKPLEMWGMWYTAKGLLVLHITLASISFTSLMVGAVFAGMYLFLHSRLKHKKWNDLIRRLPSLEMLDKYSYAAILFGIVLLVLSLSIAVVSLIREGQVLLLGDLKVITTFIVLCVYLNYFVRRTIQQRSGLETARWALIGLAFIVLNFLLNAWSGFHGWSGV